MRREDFGTFSKFRLNMFVCLLMLFCVLPAGLTPAGSPPVKITKGIVKASELKETGNFNKEIQMDVDYLNLILDTDLVLSRLEPAPGHENVALTIMATGKHSLTIDSRDKDVWDNANPPAALKAGSLMAQGCSLNIMGIWYAIEAKNKLQFNTVSVKAASANVDMMVTDGDMILQDCTVDCTHEHGSNGLAAVYGDLTIRDSEVSAYGSSSAIRGNSVLLENSTIKATTQNIGIGSNYDMTIKDCTVIADCTGDGEYDNWAGICAGHGSLTIASSNVTASGNPSGIFGGSAEGTKIFIESGTVSATGKKSAFASANPIVFGSDMTVLEPVGGKAGKTDWSVKYPCGIVTTAGKTATKAVIGPTPTEIKTTITEATPVTLGAVEQKGKSTDPSAATLPGGTVMITDDMEGSSFLPLKVKGTPQSKTKIRLTWKKAPGAERYIIYGGVAGKKKPYKKLAIVTNRYWSQKKLKKGRCYKYVVAAVRGNSVVALSKTINVATKGGKYGNPKGVTVSKKKLTIKAGKTKKITAKLKKGRGILKFKNIRFESSDPQVATVTAKGKIKALAPGTCYIYAYAGNGACARTKVIVK